MALQLRELALGLADDETCLATRIAALLGLKAADIGELRILRKGVDARRKSDIRLVYTVAFVVADEEGVLRRYASIATLTKYEPPELPNLRTVAFGRRVLVVGMGPAGLFAALRLARQGLAVTLVERGEPVEDRVKKVNDFWSRAVFDPESNVQFGEGGAGTFSDGKLTTRVNSPWNRLVLQTFVDCGAPDEILVAAKPHLGTDVLRRVLLNFRTSLQKAGVEIRFRSRLTGLDCRQGRVQAAIVNDSETIAADAVVLAPGHSSRDTYAMLNTAGVALEQKPFAVGFRVEHPVELINEIQYGVARHAKLPAADYALRYNEPESGRGIYSFCMCPGGEVIVAPSEAGGMVVNGMSGRKRDLPWSNSALVVSVGPGDFPGSDVLAGVRFQQHWEREAFVAGGSDYHAPAQNLLAFLGQGGGILRSSCRPGIREADLQQLLPAELIASLRRALPQFNRQMRGFVTGEAVLVGVESRTSAPLRIVRNDEGESVSHAGLYPCGEGAGYAGGIMSAALDGIRIAEKIVDKLSGGEARE